VASRRSRNRSQTGTLLHRCNRKCRRPRRRRLAFWTWLLLPLLSR